MKQRTTMHVLIALFLIVLVGCMPMTCEQPSGGSGGGSGMGRGGRGGNGGMGKGIGSGPGRERGGLPGEICQGEKGASKMPQQSAYGIFPTTGENIPLGCPAVGVAPLAQTATQQPAQQDACSVVGELKSKTGAVFRGVTNPTSEQMSIINEALTTIEQAHPGLAKGRQIFVLQKQEDFERVLRADGDRGDLSRVNAATSPDGRRVFIGPGVFERDRWKGVYIVAHEFGHVATRGGEVEADTWATKLMGYSFPSKASGLPTIPPGSSGTGQQIAQRREVEEDDEHEQMQRPPSPTRYRLGTRLSGSHIDDAIYDGTNCAVMKL